MKTSALVATAAGAIIGLTATAQGPVYSVNIVGFQKVAAVNAYTQAANPFLKSTTDINSVLGVQGDAGPNPAGSDNILLWNGVAYRTAYLSNDPNPLFTNKWLEEDENTGEAVVSTADLKPGVGFWIQNYAATNTFTFVGDVEMAATKSVTVNPGYNLISYPYSTTVGINSTNMNLTGSTGVLGDANGTLDNIFVWDGSAYLSYKYIVGNANAALNDKWCFENPDTGELEPAAAVFQPGQSLWYFRSGVAALAWNTTKPY